MSLSWIEISKSALLHNIQIFRQIIGPAKFMAVVKSNAYGHGLGIVPEAIDDHVDWFGTVNLDEAVRLRDLGINKPILVLSYYEEDQIESALRKNISLVVYDESQIKKLDAAARKLSTKARVHIKVDTGTSRLGLKGPEAYALVVLAATYKSIILEGVFSHLAASEDNAEYTKKQLAEFEEFVEDLDQKGIKIPLKHIACTASGMAFAESRLDLVRVGIGLYGLSSYKSRKPISTTPLIPALSWKTKIIQVKTVPKNTFVGYSCTYKTTKPTKLAVLPVGYYEGYDRRLSNNSEVLIGGIKCPVRGRICMNLMMVDVTKVKGVKAGDEAVLIGKQGDNEISASDLEKKIGSINYEVVARINPELPRVLVA